MFIEKSGRRKGANAVVLLIPDFGRSSRQCGGFSLCGSFSLCSPGGLLRISLFSLFPRTSISLLRNFHLGRAPRRQMQVHPFDGVREPHGAKSEAMLQSGSVARGPSFAGQKFVCIKIWNRPRRGAVGASPDDVTEGPFIDLSFSLWRRSPF